MIKCFFTLILLLSSITLKSQSAGDIAFIGFNTDGDRDFAIVALSDIAANSTIYFTDDETTGVGSPSALSGSEGSLTWSTGADIIRAGTIVTFKDTDSDANDAFGASIGNISRSGSFTLSGSKDGLIAFTGSDSSTPTTYIAAIQIGNDSAVLGPFDGDGITLTNTGLVIGTSIIIVDNSASPDGAYYNGPRSNQATYANYYSLFEDNSNWVNELNNGEILLPFSNEAFTLSGSSTTWDGSESNDWSNPDNWSNGIPTSDSNVTIPNTLNNPEIGVATIALAGNVTINADASLTITGSLECNGRIAINSTSSNSGSLLVTGTYTDLITYNRNLSTTNWYNIASPVQGQDIDDFVTASGLEQNLPNIALGTYNTGADTWSYYQDGTSNTDVFVEGQGYSTNIAAASGDISFTGTLKSDNLSKTLLVTGNGFNFLGNPYPSYIAADDTANASNNILKTNGSTGSDILDEDTIWIWNQATGTYSTFNLTSGLHIAPAQGFFVKAKSAATPFSITQAMQSHQSTDNFQKNISNRFSIELKLVEDKLERTTDILFLDNVTTDFDNGYDSSMFGSASNSFSIYTNVLSNNTGKNLAIQSLPTENYEDMIIPIGITAESGKEIIFSAEITNLPSGIKVFLEDKALKTITRLDESNSEYKVLLSNDLKGIGRFYLHTSANVLSSDDINNDLVHVFNSENTLRITGMNNKKISVKLINILGKQVFSTEIEGNGNNTINLPRLNTGVYIVQIASESEKLNKKIIIE